MDKNYRLKSDQIWFSGSIDFNSGSMQNITYAVNDGDAVPLSQLNAMMSESAIMTSSWTVHSLTASFVEFENIANKPRLLSSSYQIESDISGAFSYVSAGLENRVTIVERSVSSLNNATSSYVLNNQTSSMTVLSASYASNASNFNGIPADHYVRNDLTDVDTQIINGSLKLTGDIIAENFIISSSITYMTTSFSSGSTVFGNNLSNTHQFTGSVYITGSLIVNNDIISDGVKYRIPAGTTYHIVPNKQILWYGDVEVSGTILNEGKLTIINGNMLLGPVGAINLLSGSLELTSYYNQNTSDKKFVPKSGNTIITGSIGVSGSNNFFSMNSPNGNLNAIQIDNYGNLIINII